MYALAQQPQVQLYRQHRNIRKMQKYNKKTKPLIKEVIKITSTNNSINNILPVKGKFVQ
jgi:hypothetical protein